jgi:hypothetical protein
LGGAAPLSPKRGDTLRAAITADLTIDQPDPIVFDDSSTAR